ncbi:MAG: DUF5050 domain-containing protein [Ruminococcus sp.]
MKKLFLSLLIAILSVSIVGCDTNTISNGKELIIQNGDANLLIGGQLVSIDDEKVSLFDNVKNLDDSNTLNISYGNSVVIDDTIYTVGKSKTLSKYKLNDEELIEEEWVSSDTLFNNVIAETEGNSQPSYVYCMDSFQTDGNYVYFVVDNKFDYAQSIKSVANRLGRISLDGNDVEFVGDIVATAYTIDDEYIYYFDNGKEENGNVDSSRIGIYKAKLDGSKKECLYSDFEKDSSNSNNVELCTELMVKNNKIYFVDNSALGKGRVCKINMNGSGYNFVTENSAISFGFDEKGETLYFTNTDYLISTLYKKDLSQSDEDTLFKVSGGSSMGAYQEYENCLYISYESNMRYKYDIQNNKGYELKRSGGENHFEEVNGAYQNVITEVKYAWEEVNN